MSILHTTQECRIVGRTYIEPKHGNGTARRYSDTKGCNPFLPGRTISARGTDGPPFPFDRWSMYMDDRNSLRSQGGTIPRGRRESRRGTSSFGLARHRTDDHSAPRHTRGQSWGIP